MSKKGLEMKKVMVLGAGRGQIPIMNLCHKYGWLVLAVSPMGNYPGLKIADKIYYENVMDREAVLRIAQEENISAIITDQLDAGVATCAYISEKLGLNGNSTEVAERFTDKFTMRNAAQKSGIAVPHSVCVSNMDEAIRALVAQPKLKFPLMIKPVDNAASKGVYRVNNIAELNDKFESSKSYSQKGKVIIERFIEGVEYVVEAYTHNSITHNLCIGHRDYFQIPNTFIPNATVFRDADSATSELEIRLKVINKKMVENFGLRFGITHAEYLYNELEDEIYLVEVAARGGGVFISSHLIPWASGVDANNLLVRDALGIQGEFNIKLKTGAAAYFCYLTPEGVVTTLEGMDRVVNIPGVIESFFDNIELGMMSADITDKSSRKGPILVHGRNKEECYSIIEAVKREINIKVMCEGKEKDILWH